MRARRALSSRITGLRCATVSVRPVERGGSVWTVTRPTSVERPFRKTLRLSERKVKTARRTGPARLKRRDCRDEPSAANGTFPRTGADDSPCAKGAS